MKNNIEKQKQTAKARLITSNIKAQLYLVRNPNLMRTLAYVASRGNSLVSGTTVYNKLARDVQALSGKTAKALIDFNLLEIETGESRTYQQFRIGTGVSAEFIEQSIYNSAYALMTCNTSTARDHVPEYILNAFDRVAVNCRFRYDKV
jgi:hypothetical protein